MISAIANSRLSNGDAGGRSASRRSAWVSGLALANITRKLIRKSAGEKVKGGALIGPAFDD
jgi:hypothetical protein